VPRARRPAPMPVGVAAVVAAVVVVVVAVVPGAQPLGARVPATTVPATTVPATTVPATTVPAATVPAGEPGRPITVAVREIQPFAIESDGRWSGFSIDMWEAAAAKAGIDYRYRRYANVKEQLSAVTSGEADAALGAISITGDREQVVDFTQPMYDSGIGILAPAGSGDGGLFAVLRILFTRTLLFLLLALGLLVVVLGHVVWLVERRRNTEHFPHDYRHGVLEGMWWAVVTMTTVGYGDTVARTKLGRVVSVVWMLVGLVLVAQVTAVVTSTLTVDRFKGEIGGIGDLYGKKVVTVAGTTSADYLASIGLPARGAADIDRAVAELLDARADAVVYDEPVLRYEADTVARGRAEVVPELYQPQGLGMAFAEGSPLQETVSQEFLDLREDGTQETLDRRYFGTR